MFSFSNIKKTRACGPWRHNRGEGKEKSSRVIIEAAAFSSGGEGTLGVGCAAGTLEPLAYTRPSSAEYWYPILD